MFKTRIRFSLRDKRLFEITDVEITRVDCIHSCTKFCAMNARSVFNFFSIAKARESEKNDGQISAANEQPSPSHTYWRIPRDTIAADIL